MTDKNAHNTKTASHPFNRHLFIVDNIELLQALDADSIDLIATDPPFGKGRTFESGGLKPPLTAGERRKETEQMAAWGINNPAEAQEKGIEWPQSGEASYDDIWSWQDTHAEYAGRLEATNPAAAKLIDAVRLIHSGEHAAYLCYMAERLIEAKRVLKPSGSIYLHCDHTASHYLKLLMDSIWGEENFCNEIVWGYRRMPSKATRYQRMHDVILFYAGEGRTWNNPTTAPSELSLQAYHRAEKVGYNANIKKRMVTVWDWDKYHQAVEKGILPPDMKPTSFKGGRPPERDWWVDIKLIHPRQGGEGTGYPTQKPVALAERIIKASSNPGDVVLDPFAGCAYVPVAAEGLGRQWIACDISVRAMTVVRRQFNKFRLSVDGEALVSNKGEMTQPALLADAEVTVRGPGQTPGRPARLLG